MSDNSRNSLATLLPIALGMFVIGLAIWGDDAGMQAPRWVVAGAGGVFLLGGMAILFQHMPRLSAMIVALLVTLFGALATWVAFGPGERRFTASFGLPFIGVSGPSSETLGRLVFAPGAIVLDVLALFLWLRILLGRDR